VFALKCWLAWRTNSPGPLFCGVPDGRPNGKPILPNRIGQIVQECAAAVNIDRRKIGAHSLRAGCATEALENGANPFTVARHTGHASLETLKLYYRPRSNGASVSLGL
jgi:integrase